MGSPFNGDTFIEQEFLYLKERFELTTAVETGTHEADTTVWLAKNFLKTVSCELNHDLVEKARRSSSARMSTLRCSRAAVMPA